MVRDLDEVQREQVRQEFRVKLFGVLRHKVHAPSIARYQEGLFFGDDPNDVAELIARRDPFNRQTF